VKRRFKQIFYGLFYFAIVALIGWWAYSAWVVPEPTCADGVQNQGEQGIDCGGPCTPCDVARLQDVRPVRGPYAFQLVDGPVVPLLVQLSNPNQSHDALVSYRFTVSNGASPEFALGTTRLAAGERRYLYDQVLAPGREITNATFELTDVSWEPARTEVRPNIFADDITVSADSERVRVSGTLVNESVLESSRVGVVAVFFDEFGYEVFATRTTVTDIAGFEERAFEIIVPAEPLTGFADLDATEISLDVQ